MTEDPGWTTEVTSIANLGLTVFEPDMDCTMCHSMVSYVESMENNSLGAYAHSQAGLECLGCHELEAVRQVHQQAKPSPRLHPRTVKMAGQWPATAHVRPEPDGGQRRLEIRAPGLAENLAGQPLLVEFVRPA